MPAGRPRKPTHLKKLAGTLQPSRTNPLEPVPAVALGQPPEWLSATAKEYWDEIGGILLQMNLVSYGDTAAMTLLCDVLAQWVSVRVTIAKKGRVYELLSDGGKVFRARPEVAMEADLWRRASRMLVEFGLTPASRSKVSALGDKEEKDPLSALFDEAK
ncbi:phage terminase small subunit P27 family [Hymenobacter convexus]|uniref:phage terminase small subunit P27 family n=1 Tax=Hymenobacter sp. CA1UV-4 TaxID=3063782 RepID=UPI002712D761|nr:phage terminase small subunit P27 family [Hymenobacter sp. CA1UV-4]MDO7851387.1 phage terminase small subunit P27 family [Hymenobacter sp. CA1UV-4]